MWLSCFNVDLDKDQCNEYMAVRGFYRHGVSSVGALEIVCGPGCEIYLQTEGERGK